MPVTTERETAILKLLLQFVYLTAAIIRDVLIPADEDCSTTRGVLRKLERLGLIKRNNPKLVDDLSGTTAPIWTITMKGADLLFTLTGDPAMLLTVEPSYRDWMSLNHHVRVASLFIFLVNAFGQQEAAKMVSMMFEHQVIEPKAEGGKKFKLYTVPQENPRIVCAPDAAMGIQFGDWLRAWYLEFETGSDGSPARVAALKHKGYHFLNLKQLFKLHVPGANDMRCLVACPHASWRDTMRKEMKQYPSANLWAFVSTPEFLKAENPLTAEVLYTVDGGPYPLIPKTSAVPCGSTGGGEARGEAKGTVCRA